MNALGSARSYAGYAALFVAYALSHLVPSDDDLWAFGADGGDRFVGNPKYLYLHTADRHADEVRPVWLSRDSDVVAELRAAGYDAHRATSPRGLYLTLRADKLFVSHGSGDVAWWCTGSADVVQLWHGVPFKKVGADLDRQWSFGGRLTFALIGSNWEYLVVTGRRLASVFAGAYGQSTDRVLATGYPRNDVLLRDVPDATLGVDDAAYERVREVVDAGTVFAYMPTWRSGFGDLEHGTRLADADLDFERLDAVLAEADAHLLLKLHPHADLDVDIATLDRVTAAPASMDIYPLLDRVDALITDYSSVFFDYLLLDRPIVFYPYDLAAYSERPGFYWTYDAVTPGPTPRDPAAFYDAVAAVAAGVDDHADDRERVRNRVFDAPDGGAAERTYRAIRR